MKPAKFLVLLTTVILVVGLSAAAQAVSHDSDFIMEFGSNEYNIKYGKKHKDGIKEIRFDGILDKKTTAEGYVIPISWEFEAKFAKDGSIKKSSFEAGFLNDKGKLDKDGKIEGSFGAFTLTPQDDTGSIGFVGMFTQDDLKKGELYPHNPWYLIGLIKPDGDKAFSLSEARLTNILTEPGTKPGAPVPEPATLLLVGVGLIGAAGLKRKLS